MTGHSLHEHDRLNGTTLRCSCGGWSVTSAMRLAEAPADNELRRIRQQWLCHARGTPPKGRTMTLDDFCAKVEVEGGVIDALRYGLKADDLIATDIRGAELYDIWEALEAAWTSIGRLEEEASRIVDTVLDQRDDHDGEL